MTDEPGTHAALPVRLTVALCALVVLGALVAAWSQRSGERADAEGRTAPTTTTERVTCGNSACRVLSSTTVNGDTVELLAASTGGAAKLRVHAAGGEQVIDVSITDSGVRLDGDSLRCVSGPAAACLVTGPKGAATIGEVLVARGGTWKAPARPYLSDAGILTLDNVDGNDSAEVVTVQHICGPDRSAAACDKTPLVAHVYNLGGKSLGCTQRYPWPARIPGWPTIDLSAGQLRDCR